MIALIVNGGVGKRLSGLTHARMPKGHVIFGGRPLISYQIQFLVEAGIKKVVVDFDSLAAIKRFKDFCERGLIPQVDLVLHLRESSVIKQSVEQVPYCAFRSESLRRILAGNDFVKIWSDLLFDSTEISEMIDSFKEESTSIFTCLPEFKDSVSNKYPITVSDMRIIGKYDLVYLFGGVDILRKEDAALLFKISDMFCPSVEPYVKAILDSGKKIRAKSLKTYVNMNEYKDYIRVKKYLRDKI